MRAALTTFKWDRLELLLHLAIVISAGAYLVEEGYLFSLKFDNGAYELPGLHSSQLSTRLVDLSDAQWRQFRENLGRLSLGLLVWASASQSIQYGAQLGPQGALLCRKLFYCVSSLAFLGEALATALDINENVTTVLQGTCMACS